MGWLDFLRGSSTSPTPSATATSSLPGQPRCAHYRFAHLALRMIAFDRPLTFFGELASPAAHDFLAAVFKLVAEDCCAEGEPPDFKPADVKVHCARIGNHPLVVLEMPPPLAITEAYLIGAVLLVDVERDELPAEKPSLRYFTLECSQGELGLPTALLCEWTATTHTQVGSSNSASREDFVQALVAQFHA